MKSAPQVKGFSKMGVREMSQKKVSEFISYIVTAIASRALYSTEHPIFLEFTEKAFGLLDDLYVEGALSITMIGSGLIVNDAPLLEQAVYLATFLKRLKKKKIE